VSETPCRGCVSWVIQNRDALVGEAPADKIDGNCGGRNGLLHTNGEKMRVCHRKHGQKQQP